MKRIVLIFAFIGVMAVNDAFAQLEKFDELLPMVFVEGNDQIADFYIGKFEVTQAVWIAVMGNPSNNTDGNYPVRVVRWNDVQEFLVRLNALTGRSYRLPTSTEWLFAAQGGNQSRGYRYSGSNEINDVAWYRGNSLGRYRTQSTSPVGMKQPNELGIYDMSGNVQEFIQTNSNRAASIGGSYMSYANSNRIDRFRPTRHSRSDRFIFLGFRVAHAQPIPEIQPASENLLHFVASTDVQSDIDDIPINRGNTFINAQTTNFGIINVDGSTTFNLNVNMGHFVANRFALVGGLGYEYQKDYANNITLNAGFRFYLTKANKGGLFFNSQLNAAKYIGAKFDLWGFTIGGGYSFFPNNRVALEPIINFVIPFEEGIPNIFVFGCGVSIFF